MANIKLKNAQGTETTYNGVTKLLIPRADGTGNAEFSEGGSTTGYTLSVANQISADLLYITADGVVHTANSIASGTTTYQNVICFCVRGYNAVVAMVRLTAGTYPYSAGSQAHGEWSWRTDSIGTYTAMNYMRGDCTIRVWDDD